jgi:Holliday junction resolvase RusA-like endonuclease
MGVVFEFIVRSEPRPQPRPRAARIAGKIRIYTPATASLYKAAVQAAAKESVPFSACPIDSPVHLGGEFVMRRPKRMKKYECDIPHCNKPDIDNLIKSTLDGMVDSGIFRDDCIVCSVEMSKRYANEGEASHARIVIRVEEPEDLDKIKEAGVEP